MIDLAPTLLALLAIAASLAALRLASLLARERRARAGGPPEARDAEVDALRRWGELVEHSDWGVRVGSVDGRRVDLVNPAFARMHGYTVDEMRRMPVEALYPEEQREAFAAAHRRALADGHATFESVHLRRDGSRFPVLGSIAVVWDAAGAVRSSVVSVQDLSERAAAAAAIAESEDRYRIIAETASDAMITIDADNTILMVNPAVRRIFGWEPEELLGRSITLLMPDYLRHVHEAALARYVATRRRHIDWTAVELPGLHRDGHEVPLEVSFGESTRGGRHTFTGIIRDVSERRAAVAALQESEARLRQAHKMEAVGRLAGGIAHDFNNQLTAILGFAHLLRMEVPEDSRAGRDVDEIVKAAERSAALTRQLLAFSRKQVLQPRALDLGAVVTELAPMLQRLLGEQIRISTRFAPSLGLVQADPSQLEQVVVNLAVNARDAMPEGGELCLETANADLRDPATAGFFGLPPGLYALLAVSDTGVGMDAATQARIFEPFFTTKGVGEGTGLGLSTVYGIVAQSGGQVRVYSEPGYGATFKVYLPLAPGTEPAAAPEPAPADGRLDGRETVLVVDDEAAVRTLARTVLEARGYRVLEASNGDEALEEASRHGPLIHLLVTDIVMPGMHGRALADAFAMTRPEMRVLFTSGFSELVLEGRGLVLGHPFLQKPFTPEALLRTVRAALDVLPAQPA